MIKNIIKTIGLFSLIIFSFFYTEKVMTVVNEQDKLMIEIKNKKGNYKKSSIDAIIKEDTIIPGIYGKNVNVDKSYLEMKKYGIFNEKLLVYDNAIPNISLNNNYNKYIISGNKINKKISLVFILKNNINLDILLNITNNIKINYFIDDNTINNNLDILFSLKRNELYYYGDNGNYNNEQLIMNNNKINNIANNKAIYCLNINKNNELLSICSKNKLYTILPNIVNKTYIYIKDNLTNGSIIVYDINKKNINELTNVINFIRKKGYKIVGLSELLSEKNS